MSHELHRPGSAPGQAEGPALQEEKHASPELVPRPNDPELRDFLENAAIGMHWMSPEGTILWANHTLLRLLKVQPEQYIGHSLAEFAVNPSLIEELLERLRTHEAVRNFEIQLRSEDEPAHWFRIDANPSMEDDRYHRAYCFILDITEQKLSDEAQMKLAAIVESSDDAIASKDLRGVVTSWNAAAERILGYKAEEIVGKPITIIIPPELHGDEPEILRRIEAGERIEHFETIRVTKSGERINVSLTVSPVRDKTGRIIGAAKVLRDITSQKKLENALRTTERLASVGRLAATVAHEINNPLEAVTNLIYLARQDPELPESVRACLVAADEELQRVSHIARQTLGFYRDTTHPIWISIPEALEEVLAVYERRLRYKDLSIRKDLREGLRICALQGEFKQILSNLISNAIDASRRGHALQVRAWESCHPVTGASGVRLTVADTGSGIAPENLRNVFTPFFTTKKDVGTGLGLWIVRDLLEKRGGSIRCRSRVEQPSGTVMMIFLPTEHCGGE